MATWLTHLRITENLLEQIPGLEAGPFAVGNIAPDSGIPDKESGKWSPSPEITHFITEPGPPPRIADLNFYHQYLEPLKEQPANASVFSFRLGYFFHLVTDNLWQVNTYKPMRARYKEQYAEFIREVKEDWSGQDFIYVQSHPDALFWTIFLKSEPDTAGLDFLPNNALCQRMAFIKAHYQRRDEEIARQVARPMAYFSKNSMDAFVATATEKILTIYQRIWINGLAMGPSLTVMDWVFNGQTM